MPLDANLVLFSGVTGTHDNNYGNKAIKVGVDDAGYGRYVIDLLSEGLKEFAAVLYLPTCTGAYKEVLTSQIEQSVRPEYGWEAVAVFPTMYSMLRSVPCTTTTAPVEADLGRYLYGGTDHDDGLIVHIDPELYVAAGAGNIIVAMQDSGDDFGNDDEALTCDDAIGGSGGGTFVGQTSAVSTAPTNIQIKGSGGNNTHVIRFGVTKRYVRFNPTYASGNWHGLQCHITPYPFKFL